MNWTEDHDTGILSTKIRSVELFVFQDRHDEPKLWIVEMRGSHAMHVKSTFLAESREQAQDIAQQWAAASLNTIATALIVTASRMKREQ